MEALISRTNASRQKEKRLKSPAGRWLCLEEWKERKENLRLLACAVLILRRKCYYCGYGTESRPSFALSLSLFSRQEAMLLLLAFFAPVPFSPSLFPFSASLLRNVSDSDSLPFNSLYPPRQKKKMGTRQKDGGDGDEMEL